MRSESLNIAPEAGHRAAARHDAGKEQQVHWEDAKRELRKRAEVKGKSCRRRSNPVANLATGPMRK
jgi:hypothetical protein